MNEGRQALATLRDYIERSTHFREGGATRDDALKAVGDADEYLEWVEKGNEEWRGFYLDADRQKRSAEAKSRIAIKHLRKVLSGCPHACNTREGNVDAIEWLQSIGEQLG